MSDMSLYLTIDYVDTIELHRKLIRIGLPYYLARDIVEIARRQNERLTTNWGPIPKYPFSWGPTTITITTTGNLPFGEVTWKPDDG